MSNKHNISFRLDNHLDKKGEVAILIVLTFNGHRLTFSSGVHISPSFWDSDIMRPRKSAINSVGMNAMSILSEITTRANILEDVFSSLPSPSVESVKAEFNKKIHPENAKPQVFKPRTVLEWMNVFVADMSELREWTAATREKFAALSNHITLVNPDLMFDDLDEKGLVKILEHFRTVLMPDGSFGMRNSTIKKQFEYLGWFLNWCTKKGINNNMAYKSFSPALKSTQKKVIYLTDAELERLASVDLSPPNRRHLERVRDVFTYQCYSGLRFSDVSNLRWSDVKNKTMIYTTIKTDDTITVELNKYTQALLDKYRKYSFPGDRVFPAPSNQEMNRYLKELCRLAKIDDPISVVFYKGKERIDEVHAKYELIGTHAGRRTFVVKALSLGISPYVVMKWTGHSSLQSMKPYMDIVDSAKADAMKLFDE